MIVKPEVERALLARIRKKATLYFQELDMQGEPVGGAAGNANPGVNSSKAKFRVDVDAVVQLYEMFLIPLTKEVEVRIVADSHANATDQRQVDYLLERLEGLSEQEIQKLQSTP